MKMPEASRIEQGFGQEPLYLFTHAQVAKALAQQEAVMRQALEALREAKDLFTCVETCSRNNFVNLASEQVDSLSAQIKALEEALK